MNDPDVLARELVLKNQISAIQKRVKLLRKRLATLQKELKELEEQDGGS